MSHNILKPVLHDAFKRGELQRNEFQYGLYANPTNMIVGGKRPKKYIDAGDTDYDGTANFATIGDYRTMTGGRAKPISFDKEFEDHLDGRAEPYSDIVHRVMGQRRVGGKKGDMMKMAKKVMPMIRPIVEPKIREMLQKNASNFVNRERTIGGVNRLKKANRWLNFVDKGIGSIVRPITEPIAKALGSKGAETIMGGKKPRATRKPSARGAIVKKVMKEHGLNLPQASKYVKEHGLYKP